jgi:hypothetical protein
MGAFWKHRIARDADGGLHLTYARYRSDAPSTRVALVDIHDYGEATLDEMRQLARGLLLACDEPIISMREYEEEPIEIDESDAPDPYGTLDAEDSVSGVSGDEPF